jgi:NAD(P)-dependent dehydrogenase (short-subunit alcohol dehydrogenase family)
VANIFITGSADGLGKMAAQLLVAQGHNVTLHARNPQRAADALAATPGAKDAISGGPGKIPRRMWPPLPSPFPYYCSLKMIGWRV